MRFSLWFKFCFWDYDDSFTHAKFIKTIMGLVHILYSIGVGEVSKHNRHIKAYTIIRMLYNVLDRRIAGT